MSHGHEESTYVFSHYQMETLAQEDIEVPVQLFNMPYFLRTEEVLSQSDPQRTASHQSNSCHIMPYYNQRKSLKEW